MNVRSSFALATLWRSLRVLHVRLKTWRLYWKNYARLLRALFAVIKFNQPIQVLGVIEPSGLAQQFLAKIRVGDVHQGVGTLRQCFTA